MAGAACKAKSKPPARGNQDDVPLVDSDAAEESITTMAEKGLQSLAAKHGLQAELNRALSKYDNEVGPIDEFNMVALAFCAEHAAGLKHAAVCLALRAPHHTRKHGRKHRLSVKNTSTPAQRHYTPGPEL